jgi:hypothetical protein
MSHKKKDEIAKLQKGRSTLGTSEIRPTGVYQEPG